MPKENEDAKSEYEVQVIPDESDTKKPEARTSGEDDDEDYGEYSQKVQRRISKEVAKRRNAERERDAERQQRSQYEQQLRSAGTRIDAVDQQAVEAEERRIAAEISKAQRDFREAREKGDIDAESSALSAIAEAKADKKALDMYKVDRRLPGTRQNQNQPQQEASQQQTPQQAKLHPLAEEWKSENEDWFEKGTPEGRRMTTMAYAIDQELAEEGYDLNSPEYYAELTKRVQKVFPDRFKKAQTRSQPVAEVTRSTPPSRKQVRLTPTQAATARSLGLSLEDYARYVRNEE